MTSANPAFPQSDVRIRPPRPAATGAGWGRRIRIALGAGLLAFGFGLGGCSTTAIAHGPRPVTPIPIDAAAVARAISAYRAGYGLGAVTVNSQLMKVAADYARVMGERDRIKHGLGRSLPKRVEAAGYDWGFVAENLGASYSSLDDVMRGWKRSAGHRKNLLHEYALEIGIAAVATPPGSRHRNYWALVVAMKQPKNLVPRDQGWRRIK
jgi:hypothetical protein